MKKQIGIAVGGLGVLALIWVLSWSKYKEEFESPQSIEKAEEAGDQKSIRKTYRSKRFPAAKINVKKPVSKINFEQPLMMKILKPKGRSGIDLHPASTINSNNSTYAVTTNLRVVSNSKRHRYEDSQIVEEKYGKLFVKEIREEGDAIVLQNSKTRQLAIMTGVFKIKLHDHDNWSDLQSEYNLELEGNFPGIRLSLLKTELVSKAPEILELLIKDPRVQRVQLEILENPPIIK
jgi:hypothetical protein